MRDYQLSTFWIHLKMIRKGWGQYTVEVRQYVRIVVILNFRASNFFQLPKLMIKSTIHPSFLLNINMINNNKWMIIFISWMIIICKHKSTWKKYSLLEIFYSFWIVLCIITQLIKNLETFLVPFLQFWTFTWRPVLTH